MFPGLQRRVGLEEGGVLAHGVEGGHQRVPLLAPLSLPDIVGRAVLVVEGIAAGGAVELGHEGEKGRDQNADPNTAPAPAPTSARQQHLQKSAGPKPAPAPASARQ